MKTVKAKGIVFSGENVGNQFTEIAWAKKQIKEKLDFDPYNGTLNIRLSTRKAKNLKKILQNFKGIKIIPAKGFFQAHCFKILIMNKTKGAIVIPEKPGYPSNVLEIIAPTRLRKTLSLTDSDEVEITIFLEAGIKA